MEDLVFPDALALALAGMRVVHAPVDAQGLDVDAAVRSAPDAALAVVTPGQQAPLGVTMAAHASGARRWIGPRARAPGSSRTISSANCSRAAVPRPHWRRWTAPAGVLHIGTFSKTISPVLRLGFIVVLTGKEFSTNWRSPPAWHPRRRQRRSSRWPNLSARATTCGTCAA